MQFSNTSRNEGLARLICNKVCGAKKSPSEGIGLDFERDNKRYIVSIKSGPNWGNSPQQKKQESDFVTAVKVLKQAKHTLNVQPVLGICYGRVKTSFLRGYMKAVGQNLWYLISENENLYTDIIEPLGYKAKQHNDNFIKQKSRVMNLFTQEFMKSFCRGGDIDWKKLVEFNSGNLDLNKSGL